MDCKLPRSPLAAVFAALVVAACGGSDPSWIGSPPGAHDTTGTSGSGGGGRTADAGADSAPDYRDPKVGDGGCAAPNLTCGGACVAIGSDHDHCGSCNNACLGNDSMCLAGKCACSGPMTDYCAGSGCMDVSSDTNNCGSCGNVCDPNQYDTCLNGMCVNSMN